MSPTTCHVSVAILIAVAEECAILNTGAAGTAPVLLIVTPPVAAKLVRPAPMDTTVRLAPIGYATLELSGIVITTVAALLEVTMSPASPNTNVYAVPVCALMSYVIPFAGIVQFVNVPLVGVPKTGVTIVILVDVHAEITPDAGVPSTGVIKVGDVRVPVALVSTKAEGVPNAGVVKIGDVNVLLVKVSVVALPTNVSVAAGNVNVVLPAIAVASNVVVPDVVPATISLPTAPALPNVLAPVTVCITDRC